MFHFAGRHFHSIVVKFLCFFYLFIKFFYNFVEELLLWKKAFIFFLLLSNKSQKRDPELFPCEWQWWDTLSTVCGYVQMHIRSSKNYEGCDFCLKDLFRLSTPLEICDINHFTCAFTVVLFWVVYTLTQTHDPGPFMNLIMAPHSHH